MTRIVKKPDERRNELIQAALELFQTKGYAATSVEAIILKIGVAKGTFYYYFKSKEDILEAVVDHILGGVVEEDRKISTNPKLNALEKLRLLLTNQNPSRDEARGMIESLHLPENRELHEKVNVETVLQLSPIFAEIVEQGVKEGLFDVDHALETSQFLLTGTQFLTDLGFFHWSNEELQVRTQVMATIIERSLGAKEGTFGFLID